MNEAEKKREMCKLAISLPGIVFDLAFFFPPLPSLPG